MVDTGLAQDERVVADPDGRLHVVRASNLRRALDGGYREATPDEVKERVSEREFGDRPIAAGALGFARGATLGLSDALLTGTGIAEPETLREIEDRNAMASLVGEVGSLLVPGTGVAKVGSLVGRAARGAGIGARIARGAAEGAAIGLGHSVSGFSLGRPEADAEALVADVGLGALLGGAAGGLVAGAGRAKAAASKALDRVASGPQLGLPGIVAPDGIASRVGRALGDAAIDKAIGAAVGATLGGLGGGVAGYAVAPIIRGGLKSLLGRAARSSSASIDQAIEGLLKAGGRVASPTGPLTLLTARILSAPGDNETRDEALGRIASDLDLLSSPSALDGRIHALIGGTTEHPEMGVALPMVLAAQLSWLRSRVPRTNAARSPLSPVRRSGVPRREMDRFEAELRDVMDPLGAVGRLASGSAGSGTLRTLEATYPELVRELRTRTLSRLADRPGPMTASQRRRLGSVLGASVEGMTSPDVLAVLQRPVVAEDREGDGADIDVADPVRSRSDQLAD